ncbi:hypothetical protein C8Q75DRAFT_862786 [Abortiporus biennis]|nr:hypothetical protein C8Q75DRAFT_862786 [Abortiporus biennis]
MTTPGAHLIHNQMGEFSESDIAQLTNLNIGMDELNAYIMMQLNCCRSYRDDREFREAFQTYPAQLQSRPMKKVLEGANSGNAVNCLEAGIRYYTGCTVRKNAPKAIEYLRRVADPMHTLYLRTAPRRVRAHAFSCLCAIHWDSRVDQDGTTWNMDSMFRATSWADGCCALGLVTPQILSIGAATKKLMDEPVLREWDLTRFHDLEYLREALGKRDKEVKAEKERRDKKGCGIGATKKASLLRCGGTCPPDIKPHYCSKECQKADWKRHKPSCKPALVGEDSKVGGTTEQETEEINVPSPATLLEDDLAQRICQDGKERTIEIPSPANPSEKIVVSSTTMTPAFMREFRDQVTKMSESRTSVGN